MLKSLLLALSLASAAWATPRQASCRWDHRHLVVEAALDKAQFSLRLHDFQSLASNPSLWWDLEGASASTVRIQDEFGFPWTLKTAAEGPAGRCRVRLSTRSGILALEVSCFDLRSADDSVPGVLSPAPLSLRCSVPR